MIQNSLESGHMTVCVFLDIWDAFANTSHAAIRSALHKRCVEKVITDWMSEMLATTVGRSTIEVRTTRGTRQKIL